jgi:hypothetical protein
VLLNVSLNGWHIVHSPKEGEVWLQRPLIVNSPNTHILPSQT